MPTLSDRHSIELSESLGKRLQRLAADARYLLLGQVSRMILVGETAPTFGELKTFCCFVGHGRSGGTLVGALLNAHPNIVMSNELNALRRLRLGLSSQQLFRLIYLVSRRQVQRGSIGGGGYSYQVQGQWQGGHRRLTVIGDRKAGATAYEIAHNPGLLDLLARKIELQKKFVHVIRNPFDTIATTFKKTPARSGEDCDAHLNREIRNYFARCSAVQKVEQTFGATSIHYLHHERLIADPLSHLRQLCEFLGVEAYPDYLHDCGQILNTSPHQSRKSITWTNLSSELVGQGMKKFHWLADYESTP